MPSSLNGTGVTFNDGSTLQSGNIPAANLGSGTANSNTFLRGDRTFATLPPAVIADGSVSSAKILPPTAGNNTIYVITILNQIGSVGAPTVYPPVGRMDGFLARVLINGVIRCNFQHRCLFSDQTTTVRVLKNNSQIQEFTTNSTSLVTRNVDVTVAQGDIIEIQHKVNASDSTGFLQNARIASGNITPAVA